MFKKCLVVGCNRIVWFSNGGICPKCEKEAVQIVRIAGRNRPDRRALVGPQNYKGNYRNG